MPRTATLKVVRPGSFRDNGQFAPGNDVARLGDHDRSYGKQRRCTQVLISQLHEYCREKGQGGKTNLERITERLIANALAGDQHAIEYIFDRVDGRAKQQLALPGDDESDDDVEVTLAVRRVSADGTETTQTATLRKAVDISEAD